MAKFIYSYYHYKLSQNFDQIVTSAGSHHKYVTRSITNNSFYLKDQAVVFSVLSYCRHSAMLLNPWVATQKWVALKFDGVVDNCNGVKIKSLLFMYKNYEIRDRFKFRCKFSNFLWYPEFNWSPNLCSLFPLSIWVIIKKKVEKHWHSIFRCCAFNSNKCVIILHMNKPLDIYCIKLYGWKFWTCKNYIVY